MLDSSSSNFELRLTMHLLLNYIPSYPYLIKDKANKTFNVIQLFLVYNNTFHYFNKTFEHFV